MSIIQLDSTAMMLHFHRKDRSSLILEMLLSVKYYLIFFNQQRNKNYLHQKKRKKSSYKSLLHGSWSTIISSLQPLWSSKYQQLTSNWGDFFPRANSPVTNQSSSCSFTIHVKDTEPPRVASCPHSFTGQHGARSTGREAYLQFGSLAATGSAFWAKTWLCGLTEQYFTNINMNLEKYQVLFNRHFIVHSKKKPNWL